MNWTGGYLNRHSKANGKPLLKSQRQYFAKAKQRLQNGPVHAAPSTFSLFHGQVTSDKHHQRNRSPSTSKRYPTSLDVGFLQEASPDRLTSLVNDNASFGKERQTRSTERPEHTVARRHHTPDNLNPLDRIKRRLLQESDWAGLAISRPVSIAFTPAEEMERIGRRRKITKEERKRKLRPARLQMIHHNLIRPFEDHHAHSSAPVPAATDLSIRIGSNIHQTLTTLSSLQEPSQSSSHRSTNGDSMLLDKFEHHVQNSKSKSRDNVQLASDEGTVSPSRKSNLLPLNEARDLKSFDEVLERSSSIVRQVMPSSTPFGDPQPRAAAAQSRNRAASSTNGRQLVEKITQYVPMTDPEQTPAHVENTYGEEAERMELSDGIRHDHSGVVEPEFRMNPPHSSTPASYHRLLHVTPGAQGQQTLFTLDHQVALEQEMSGSVEGHSYEPGVFGNSSGDPQKALNTQSSQSRGRSPPATRPGSALHRMAAAPLPSMALPSATDWGASAQTSPSKGHVLHAKSRTQERRRPLHTLHKPVAVPRVAEAREPMSWMRKFQLVKEQQHTTSVSRGDLRLGGPDSRSGRLGDENEAWMRFVFPKDFGRIQDDFKFEECPSSRKNTRPTPVSPLEYGTQVSAPDQRYAANLSHRAEDSIHASGISAPTAANATIFDPKWNHTVSTDPHMSQSETDFLSRFSPMEGVLDERLADVSIHNNAADTEKSFVSISRATPELGRAQDRQQYLHTPARQIIPAKRAALHALDSSNSSTSSNKRLQQDLSRSSDPLPRDAPRYPNNLLRIFENTPEHALARFTHRSTSSALQHHRRHREAAFPMACSPGSSHRSKASQQTIAASPNFHPSPRPNLRTADDRTSASGRNSLWQVSPGVGDQTGSSASGTHHPNGAMRTPLFGNDEWPM